MTVIDATLNLMSGSRESSQNNLGASAVRNIFIRDFKNLTDKKIVFKESFWRLLDGGALFSLGYLCVLGLEHVRNNSTTKYSERMRTFCSLNSDEAKPNPLANLDPPDLQSPGIFRGRGLSAIEQGQDKDRSLSKQQIVQVDRSFFASFHSHCDRDAVPLSPRQLYSDHHVQKLYQQDCHLEDAEATTRPGRLLHAHYKQ